MARRRDNQQLTPAMRHEGQIDVRARGMRTPWIEDIYHRLIGLSWVRLGALFVTSFLAFNMAFAALYRLDPTGLALESTNQHLPLFWRDFFFSVHTVATIGYGNVYPLSMYANGVVVGEITIGIFFFALTTGIVFARFSRPTARILFSGVAVVRRIDGVPTLMLRAANQRHNLIYAAAVQVSVLRDETMDGRTMRRFVDLKLERSATPVFALTWTIMHHIDEDSPLHDWVDHQSRVGNAEIVVVLSGTDAASGQAIHGRYAYRAEDIRWDKRFVDILSTDADGVRTIDYERFHTVED
ncbi:ion channel [Parablastomonas sp. CN1-191]|uniref:ion channel n=1 Tax=Parablastomonas sp. CN1-191 TaxID=3400908 RepID=UPI003BF8255F